MTLIVFFFLVILVARELNSSVGDSYSTQQKHFKGTGSTLQYTISFCSGELYSSFIRKKLNSEIERRREKIRESKNTAE